MDTSVPGGVQDGALCNTGSQHVQALCTRDGRDESLTAESQAETGAVLCGFQQCLEEQGTTSYGQAGSYGDGGDERSEIFGEEGWIVVRLERHCSSLSEVFGEREGTEGIMIEWDGTV